MSDSEKLAQTFLLEMAAWRERNAMRKKLRDFYNKYKNETDGGWYLEEHAEPDESNEHDALRKAAKAAQRKLNTARAATRRIAKKIEQEKAKVETA